MINSSTISEPYPVCVAQLSSDGELLARSPVWSNLRPSKIDTSCCFACHSAFEAGIRSHYRNKCNCSKFTKTVLRGTCKRERERERERERVMSCNVSRVMVLVQIHAEYILAATSENIQFGHFLTLRLICSA